MDWVEGIGEAIRFIESNMTGDLSMEAVARHANVSAFYFQKGFAILCGFTVGEYIRQRRLALAGSEVASTREKIIDIAMKYGYDSPDSFTKAFTRFHGVTPTAVRRGGAMIKSFAPLRIKFSLEGGYIMDYRIAQKDGFTVLGVATMIEHENAMARIPKLWEEHYRTGKGEIVCGQYGICIDDGGRPDGFEYLIADHYKPSAPVPQGFVLRNIPKHTWAVFPCRGAMPDAIQAATQKIFSEWLPGCGEYEIVAGYNVEMYDDPNHYPKKNRDINYYSEIWIPVKRK